MCQECVFSDSNWIYSEDTGRMLAVNTRSPFNNIYTGIPNPLLDPVLERHVNEVMEIISRTFWANVGAWRFTQACREMVHRGLNVN